MKPENELLAEEVAFVNTCGKMAEMLAGLDCGRHRFELNVYGEKGELVAEYGNMLKLRDIDPEELAGQLASAAPGEHPDDFPNKAERAATGEPGPLTLEEFDKIVRTGEAELPPMVHVSEPIAAEMQRLEEELPFEVPATDGITDTPFPPGSVIMRGPGAAEAKTPKRKGK